MKSAVRAVDARAHQLKLAQPLLDQRRIFLRGHVHERLRIHAPENGIDFGEPMSRRSVVASPAAFSKCVLGALLIEPRCLLRPSSNGEARLHLSRCWITREENNAGGHICCNRPRWR
jgi:hypothetical protein